eukprot:CFRG8579T1
MSVILSLHGQRKFAVGPDDSTYLFDLAGNASGTLVAASASNHSIKMYNANDLSLMAEFKGHTARVSGIKFSPTQADTLYSSSVDGTVCKWNVVSGNRTIIHNAGKQWPLTSFDVNCDDTVMCVGTELVGHDAKVIYIQLAPSGEGSRVIAEYSNVHNDDITCICFHPTSPTVVLSGSTDGLVSLIDLAASPDMNEDDNLLLTLNTDSSVASVGFFGPSAQFIYSTTHIESLFVWDTNEGTQLVVFKDVRESARKCAIPVALDYIVTCVYHAASQRLFMVGGTFEGNLSLLHVNRDSLELVASMPKQHKDMVRCCFWNTALDHIFTGDENAVLCKWGTELPSQQVLNNSENSQKVKSTYTVTSTKRASPY